MSQPTKKQSKEFDEYECGNGPRPPVPGEECKMSKMTTEGASTSTSQPNPNLNLNLNPNQSPESESAFSARIAAWNRGFDYLLADDRKEEGVQLLLKFVEDDSGKDSTDYTLVNFYFLIEGIKVYQDETQILRLIRVIKRNIRNRIKIPPETERKILQMTKTVNGKPELTPDPHIFDDLQETVKVQIATRIYPEFLKSKVWIDFVEERMRGSEVKPINSSVQANFNSYLSGCAGGAAGFTVGVLPLVASSNLQTLHEDTELNLNDGPTLRKSTTDRQPKLTKDLLLVTQNKRLEVRPEGAHGYTYSINSSSSFNPVSRQDSERQSLSSASLTDSELYSKDGRPYMHRKPTAAEDYRKTHMNPPVASHKTPIRPLSQGLRETIELNGTSQKRLEEARYKLDANVLFEKLNEVKRKIERDEMDNNKSNMDKNKFSRCLVEKLQREVEEDDGQSILDEHVSRVFSPNNANSPGTISPRHLNRLQHRSNQMTASMPEFVQSSMRHSRSMEHASTALPSTSTKKWPPIHKWPSMNNDSGLGSLYSANMPYKPREVKPVEADDTMRKSSRMRKQLPLPPSHQSYMPTTSSHHTNSLARKHESGGEYTTAVYRFVDEELPYRIRIPGVRITLKQFKDFSPRKGNFRYFFTAVCNDLDSPVILQEVSNDTDVLPIFEGKVRGTLKFN